MNRRDRSQSAVMCDALIRRAARAVLVSLATMTIIFVGGCESPTAPEPVVPGTYMVSESHLYWSQTTADGVDRLIGAIRTADGAVIAVTDLATAPDGSLFAVSRSQLYRINAGTAVATPIGAGLPDRTNALCFNAASELFAATASTGTLYRIDLASGGFTPIGSYGSSWLSSGDLVFRSDGILLATMAHPGDNYDALATVNQATGAATVVRQDLPNQMYGLRLLDGVIYGCAAADRGLYVINGTTGAFVRVRTLSFAPYGSKSSDVARP